MTAVALWDMIDSNEELKQLELEGFERGEKKGKTMDVPLSVLYESLRKQYIDWIDAYKSRKIVEMERTLADLRSVAGVIFLKLQKGGDENV